MQNYVSKLFNSWANSLVLFSQRHGRQGWLTFLFILTLTIIVGFPSIGNSQKAIDLNIHKLADTKIAQTNTKCSIKDISFKRF